MNGMSKWEMTKALMLGIAYLVTGITLILSVLSGLGLMIDFLTQSYPNNIMSLVVSLIPLLVLVVGIGWGAFFIWKSTAGVAPALVFHLIGKAGYKMFALHHITVHQRKGIGALIALIGLIIVCVEVIPAGIKLFSESIISLAHPFIALLGLVALIVSMAIAEYEPMNTPPNGRG